MFDHENHVVINHPTPMSDRLRQLIPILGFNLSYPEGSKNSADRLTQEIPALPKSETSSSQPVDPSPICHNASITSTASLAASPRLDFGVSPNCASYLSFRDGDGERIQDGRHFTDFTESDLKEVLAHHSELEVVHIWTSEDARPNRADQWINSLARKRQS
jgi:hypothetical protein